VILCDHLSIACQATVLDSSNTIDFTVESRSNDSFTLINHRKNSSASIYHDRITVILSSDQGDSADCRPRCKGSCILYTHSLDYILYDYRKRNGISYMYSTICKCIRYNLAGSLLSQTHTGLSSGCDHCSSHVGPAAGLSCRD
jgi:hypothetical protein